MFLNFSITIFSFIIELIDFDLFFLLTYDIILLCAIISLASKACDKILKGLQGTAATTIIARGAYDAYNK
jgi:hypothetical protein